MRSRVGICGRPHCFGGEAFPAFPPVGLSQAYRCFFDLEPSMDV
jgi:hypothetical protein